MRREVELSGIFEGGYICRWKGKPFFDDVLERNIEEALRREGLIGDGDYVVIPPGGALAEIDCERGTAAFDFGVYDKNGNLVYRGTAYGNVICTPKGKGEDPCNVWVELEDLTAEVEDVRG